ncbi:MAG: ABC transporter ATP-binding protein [Alphaproteobacteria bacterium]|nr:ABC transporter ATP-binding protein [Alphaproteobacteria bacterium]
MTSHGLTIFFRAVAQSFGPVHALLPLDLEIAAGEFLTLLGPSGSGKTTLLNIAAGYLTPTAGRVLIGAKDVTDLAPRHRNIGMVFQNYALFPHLDVFENIAYGLRARKTPKDEIAGRVAAALELVQLTGYAARAIRQLSGGQQQRVALARALVIEPDVLLMDEPLGALDRQLRQHVQLEIRRLHRQHGRTTIYVTHDQEEALVMSDRIAIMHHGRIEQIGSAEELYRRPRSAFVAGFLGESNLLPGVVVAVDQSSARMRLDGLDREVAGEPADSLKPGMRAAALIRPEALRLAAGGSLPARVVETIFLGELFALRLGLANGQTMLCRQFARHGAPEGSAVGVEWDPRDVRILPDTAGAKSMLENREEDS